MKQTSSTNEDLSLHIADFYQIDHVIELRQTVHEIFIASFEKTKFASSQNKDGEDIVAKLCNLLIAADAIAETEMNPLSGAVTTDNSFGTMMIAFPDEDEVNENEPSLDSFPKFLSAFEAQEPHKVLRKVFRARIANTWTQETGFILRHGLSAKKTTKGLAPFPGNPITHYFDLMKVIEATYIIYLRHMKSSEDLNKSSKGL